MQNVSVIERFIGAESDSESLIKERHERFPVTITAVKEEMPPAFLSVRLPACSMERERMLVPVGILDIKLNSGREMVVDGKSVAIPFGAKKKITVRALKELARAYLGSIILMKRENSWIRLRDWEAVEIPEAGKEAELKTMPSFKSE